MPLVSYGDGNVKAPRLGSAGVTRARTFVLVADSTNPPGAVSAAAAGLAAMRMLTSEMTETRVSAARAAGVGAVGLESR
jgi:hypothetical protein